MSKESSTPGIFERAYEAIPEDGEELVLNIAKAYLGILTEEVDDGG